MMGLGSLGNGGSSSSYSNLSPLAPPFTVDRSNSKPTSNNFSDYHYTLTVPFGQSWQYADPVPTTCMPLSPEFSPSGSVNPSTTIWPTSNPTAKTSTEGYSFGCEGYYAPYVSPIGNAETPLGAFHEPSFDVPVNGSSHVDYTQSLSGLEYPVSHWDPVWSRMSDGKQDEWKGVDGSFSVEKVDAGASFGYMNCLSQGNSLDGVNIAGEDSYALSGNFTDRLYTGSSSIGHMDDKPYLPQEPVYSSFNSKTGSIPPASCQAGLSLGSSKNYLNYENPFTPHDKFFQPLDSCLHDATPTSKSSPAVVIRPAPSGSHFFGKKTGLNKTVDICKTGASNSEKSDACDLLKVDETRQPIGSPVKGFSLDTISLNFGKEVKDSVFFASSLLNNGCSSHPRVSNIAEISGEERSGAQAPYSSTFTEKCADALDLHNPNVDSPCWKGAPASRISLYDSVEAPSPYHFKSKLEYSDFGQSNSLFPQAEHSGGTSSKKLGEDNLHNHNGYAGIGTRPADYITEEHRADGVTKDTFEHIGLSSYSGVLKFSQDLNKPSKGYDLSHYENDSQLESSRSEHVCVDEHKFGPTKQSLEEDFMHAGLNLNDALEGGVVALDAVENVLRSPASQEEAKQAQPYQTGSSPKLNVQTLVNAIHNLSELLKSQYLTNACLLEEQDHETLKHAITNLGACTSKKIETKEKLFSQHDSFEKAGEPRGCYMGAGTGHHQFMEEITSNSCGLGYQLMHEDKSRSTGKKAEKSPLVTPIEDDLGDSKEEQVPQAIKKALDENFLCDEDMQLQALLFKNLWLEAEAKLCSISYKARFDCMKIKMEKHKMSQGKDVSVDETAANKILSFKFSPDLNMNFSAAPEAENNLTSNTGRSSSTSSKSVHIDGSDDSVMERFNIVNRREEILSSSFMKGVKDSAKVASDAEDSVTMRLNILKQQMNNFSSSFMEDGKVPDKVANDAEDSVMERLNILKWQADNLKSSFMEEEKDQAVVTNDAENSVMARLNILRQRGDYLNSSYVEEKKDPDMVPDYTEDDSVMARFNVLEHRGDSLSSPFMEAKNDQDEVAAGSAGTQNLGLLKGGLSGDERPNVVIEPYFYYHGVNVGEGKFGSCVDDSGYDSMKQFLLSAADDPVVHPNRKTRRGNQLSPGLYDNSSSDWEHVAKDELV